MILSDPPCGKTLGTPIFIIFIFLFRDSRDSNNIRSYIESYVSFIYKELENGLVPPYYPYELRKALRE